MTRSIALVGVLCCLGGCAFQPWIKPYQRAKLEDSVMSPVNTPLADYYRQRAFATHEGAHGIGGADLSGSSAGDP